MKYKGVFPRRHSSAMLFLERVKHVTKAKSSVVGRRHDGPAAGDSPTSSSTASVASCSFWSNPIPGRFGTWRQFECPLHAFFTL